MQSSSSQTVSQKAFCTSSQFAQRAIEAMDNLRAYGGQKDVEIPQFCVVGDQSSGKSSLLEGVTGAPLPRSNGMTTKCPIEFRMKKDESCDFEATIRIIPNDAGLMKDVREPETVDNRESLQTVLKNFHDTLCGDTISNDVICVSLRGAEMPNLTLIDLPGIIHTSTGGTTEQTIRDIRDIVNRYMEKSRTIILAVIPCNQDIATTSVLQDASRYDPNGERTLGVLTKPDLIVKGDEAMVSDILANKTLPLRHGYIMVHNPSQDDLNHNISAKEANAKEDAFFNTHPVFNASAFAGLLGKTALAQKLQPLLVKHIKKAIDPMRNELRTKTKECETSLTKMGCPPPDTLGDCIQIIQTVKDDFLTALNNSTGDASYDEDSLTNRMSMLRNGQSEWYKNVRRLRPDFDVKYVKSSVEMSDGETVDFNLPAKCFENGNALKADDTDVLLTYKDSQDTDEHKYTYEELVREVEGGYSNVSIAPPPSRVFTVNHGPLHLPLGDQLENVQMEQLADISHSASADDDEDTVSPVRRPHIVVPSKPFLSITSSNGTVSTIQHIDEAKFTIQEVYYKTPESLLEDIRTKMAKFRGRSLPGFLNFSVFTSIIQSYTKEWHLPTQMHLLHPLTNTVLEDVLAKCLECNEALTHNAKLQELIRESLVPVLNTAKKTLEDEVKKLFEHENHPSTLNHYLYDTYHKIRIRRFQQAVESRLDFTTRQKTYTATEVRTLMNGVMAETIGNASNAEQEAQEMVDVLSAYWTVMFKRWADNVAQAVDTCYVSQLVEPCREALRIRFSMLGSHQEKQVLELFEEPLIDRQRRTELNERLFRMKRAIQELDRLCESRCNDIVVDDERDGWDNLCETTETDKV